MRPHDTLAEIDRQRRVLDRAMHVLHAEEPDRKDPRRPAWEADRRSLVALYSGLSGRACAVLAARAELWRRTRAEDPRLAADLQARGALGAAAELLAAEAGRASPADGPRLLALARAIAAAWGGALRRSIAPAAAACPLPDVAAELAELAKERP
jgi:hypothetical protein